MSDSGSAREAARLSLRWGRRVLAVMIGIDILVGSLTPLLGGLNLIPDKWQHFLAYLVWGFVLTLSSRSLGRRALYLAVALFVGAAIEIIQPMVGRQMSLLDFLADAAGLALGALIGLPARRLSDRLEQRIFG